MDKLNCIIYCNCTAGIISDEKQYQLAETFKSLNIKVFELHDLCAFSLSDKGFFAFLEENYDKKFIVACYPRAIKNMFIQNNISLSNYEVLNFRELTTENIVSILNEKIAGNSSPAKYEVRRSSLEVPAWYPVIDKSRCTLCKQCARFCVFGVYIHNKTNLDVVNPLACKNNCPACGRTCPASAIIFPRLAENNYLSGAEPGDEEPLPAGQRMSLSTDKNEGLFDILNERNNAQRNIFKQGFKLQAEEEKKAAIEKLKKEQEKE